jgi:hypothetical protein
MNSTRQLSIVNRALPQVFHSCFHDGCRRMAWPGELYCRDCQAQLDWLDAQAQHEQLQLDRLEGREYALRAKPAASRLSSGGWAAASIGVFFLLLWETRDFWLELIRMWARRL